MENLEFVATQGVWDFCRRSVGKGRMMLDGSKTVKYSVKLLDK